MEIEVRVRTGRKNTRKIRVPAAVTSVWAELRNMDSPIDYSMRVMRKRSDLAVFRIPRTKATAHSAMEHLLAMYSSDAASWICQFHALNTNHEKLRLVPDGTEWDPAAQGYYHPQWLPKRSEIEI